MATDPIPQLSHAPAVAQQMAAAARAFLGSLSSAERDQASFPFDGEERYIWNYTPVPRNGLRLKEMGPAQRQAAMALMERRCRAVAGRSSKAIS